MSVQRYWRNSSWSIVVMSVPLKRTLPPTIRPGFTQAVEANSRWLAAQDEELDELTVGFWPDAFS